LTAFSTSRIMLRIGKPSFPVNVVLLVVFWQIHSPVISSKASTMYEADGLFHSPKPILIAPLPSMSMSGVWDSASRMKCDSTAVAKIKLVLVLGRLDLSGIMSGVRAISAAQISVAARLWEYGKKMYCGEVSGLTPAVMLIFSMPVSRVNP